METQHLIIDETEFRSVLEDRLLGEELSDIQELAYIISDIVLEYIEERSTKVTAE